MTDITALIAQHLEVPRELILRFKEYPEENRIAVLLTDHRKMEVPHNLIIEPIIDLTTPSHAQQLHDETHPPPQLTDIVGLGRTSNDRLEEAGITTLEQLIASSPEEIAKIVKQNAATVKGWQKQAKALL